MSASPLHNGNLPTVPDSPQGLIEQAKGEVRKADDCLFRAYDRLMGNDYTFHDADYASEQLGKAVAFVTKAQFLSLAARQLLVSEADTVILPNLEAPEPISDIIADEPAADEIGGGA